MRLLIKSTLCSNDLGVFEDQDQLVDDKMQKVKVKIKDRIAITPDAEFSVNEATKTLTVTIGGAVSTMPIPDYALSLKGHD